ncbi:MAG: ATP-binding protein, partial [Sulfolobales archaeon]
MEDRFNFVVEMLKHRSHEALSKLSAVGKIIGFVSRRTPSKVSEGGVRVVVEVDPGVYFSEGVTVGVGDYLVATDLKSLKHIGLKVMSVSRADAASEIATPLSLGLDFRVEGLMTFTLIEAEPMLTEEGLPVTSPIEPQSPVAIPTDPHLLQVVTGLPTDGVVIGALTSPLTLNLGTSVPLKLPRYEFFKHLFVIGTTGAGKTTFIKNLVFSLLSSWKDVFVSIIDATGDYTQIAIPPNKPPGDSKPFINGFDELIDKYPKWVTYLVPLRRRLYRSLIEFSKTYIHERFGKILSSFHNKSLSYEYSLEGRDLDVIKSILVTLNLDTLKINVEIIPISLSYVRMKDHLDALPLFSRQARLYLRNIISYIENQVGSISNFTSLYMMFTKFRNEIINDMKLHNSTIESIERVFNFLASSDDVDVVVDSSYLGVPSIDVLVRECRGPVVLDLDYSLIRGSSIFITNLIAYEYLRSLYEWKRTTHLVSIDKPAMIILDEAHRFFPSEGSSREEVDMLADFISMIARLGRAKGLGFVFSTHSPKDVHKIISQLTNTKIIFRSEREFLELIDIAKEYMNYLRLAPDRVGLLRSSSIRSGYVLFKTSEPLLGHYDIGRT